VLSHAHIDHSGRLPLLRKQGFTGPIFTHRATADLCGIMLRDAAYLHEKDAEWQNKRLWRKGLATVEPLYTRDDVSAVLGQFVGLDYDARQTILPGVEATLRNAGHILGAAIVELTLHEEARQFRLVFSGDLGYSAAPLMQPPASIDHADLVLMESTYGDRDHRSYEQTVDELAAVVTDAVEHGGKIIAPVFAVGRAQELLYHLGELERAGRIPPRPVFLDSPMAISVTELYRAHTDEFEPALAAAIRADPARVLPSRCQATRTPEESMALNDRTDCIVLAASGMCEAGRILHHLRNNVEDPRSTVMIVGYCADHTLGKRIVERQKRVRIFGEEQDLRAQVEVLNSLSAHADEPGLVEFLGHHDPARLREIFLVHGSPERQEVLRQTLSAGPWRKIGVPSMGQSVVLEA